MAVKVANYSGFCKGVKRAIDTAKLVGHEYNEVVTLGPIVHNQFVVDELARHGVGMIDSEDDLQNLKSGVAVVLRSHGVSKEIYRMLDEKNITYIDATCQFVKAVHQLASKAHSENKHVVIVGDPKHPEVIGILGWTDGMGYVVKDLDDVSDLPNLEGEIVVVAQTTQTGENWNTVIEALQSRFPKIKTYNTICKATSERQTATIELAKEVDMMLVVGSYSSSNTKKLAQVCMQEGTETYQIESYNDIQRSWFHKGIKNIGITAGASTPDWVLKEVVQMVEEIQNQTEEMEVSEMKSLDKGDVVKGTVTKVEDNQVTVDVGYKFDGIIPIGELSCLHIETANDAVKIGDEIELEVLRINDEKGKLILSKKTVDSKRAWEVLQLKYDNQEAFEVVVADVVKGGLVVDLGVRGFIPASHVERHFVEDFSDYKGRTLQVKIIEFDREANKVILSQKVVLDEQAEMERKQAMNLLKEGEVIEGTVQRLTDFGAFVDVGGIDGLVHVSELAWYRVDHPSDIVKEGDSVKVKILSVDSENERISLSLKAAQPSPWDEIATKVHVGDILQGTVKRLVSFGAFVELFPGVEGLVHISEISPNHIGTPGDVLEIGQTVNVKVLDINTDEKRVSLSIRQTIEEKREEETMHIDLRKNGEQTTYTLGDMIGEQLKKLQ